METPWWIDVITACLVALWMLLTFATIQMYGPSLQLIVAALVIAVAGILLIYGQRMTYLRVGDRLVIGMDSGPYDDEGNHKEDGVKEWQRENR